VTLSFDNGPAPGVTDAVLDLLASRQVRGTFFVVGQKLSAPGAGALASRAAAEGHWIGNHTMTHTVPFGDRAGETNADAYAACEREIGATQELIGDLAHPDRLFRPFGRGGILDERLLSADAVRYLQEGRYSCVLWSSVPHDWDQPDEWVDRALADVSAQEWTVVVLHDLPTGAMRHLPEFLDRLADVGAEVVQEFPDACVPIRAGEVRGSLDHLIAP
jgi:peptidoglycan/xylan/chitin deacetylase (PgdA/CDA1 family)